MDTRRPYSGDNGQWGVVDGTGAVAYEADFTEWEAWLIALLHNAGIAHTYDEVVAAATQRGLAISERGTATLTLAQAKHWAYQIALLLPDRETADVIRVRPRQFVVRLNTRSPVECVFLRSGESARWYRDRGEGWW